MYGTVAYLRVKSGRQDVLVSLLEQWREERKPRVQGALDSYVFKMDADPQDWILVALFEDRESYFANANDPEQSKWFERFMEHLEGRAPLARWGRAADLKRARRPGPCLVG